MKKLFRNLFIFMTLFVITNNKEAELDKLLVLSLKQSYFNNAQPNSEFSKRCICGYQNDGLQMKAYVNTVYMPSLFATKFSWKKAVKNQDKIRTSEQTQNQATVSTQGFWSYKDRGWMTMQMQAALILGMLQGMEAVINEPFQVTDESFIKFMQKGATECHPHLQRVYNGQFSEILAKHILSEKKKLKGPPPLDEIAEFMGLVQTEDNKLEEQKKFPFFFIYDDLGKNTATETVNHNYVTCKIHEGMLVYHEQEGKNSYKYYDKDTTAKIETKDKKKDIWTVTNALYTGTLTAGNPMTSRASMWKILVDELGDEDVVTEEDMTLPNKFEYTLCTILLTGNKLFEMLWIDSAFDTSDWATILEHWQDLCPMISWKGPWLVQKDGKYEKSPTMYKFNISIQDMYVEEGAFKNNNTAPNFRAVTKNEEFTAAFKLNKEQGENEAKEEEDIINQELQELDEKEKTNPVPEIDIAQENDIAKLEIDNAVQSQEKSEESGDDEEEKKEEEEEGESNKNADIISVVTEAEIDITESEAELECKNRREVLEAIYGTTGYKPKNAEEAANMIKEMMGHPHDIPCKHVLAYVITNTEVFLREPTESVMKYEVKKIQSEQLEAAGQDPNFDVYQIHFTNHMFDDEMDALYYIPAREMANEWDKFPSIMMKFCDFSDTNLGNKLNPGLVYTGFYNHFRSFINSDNTYKFIIETGASGPAGQLGSSTKEEFETIMGNNPGLQYIMYILRIINDTGDDNGGFYDVIFQCWVLNDKYLMVKMSGTQLNYQVMINKYAQTSKLSLIFAGMTDALKENFLDTNSAVVSIHKAKQLTFDTMIKICEHYKFTCEENSLDEAEGEKVDNRQAHFNIIAEQDNKFMFAMFSEAVEKEFSVRGFIHTRENIPVMNIFFTMDIFQSEYIIPLVNVTDFTGYLVDIFHECYKHLYFMMSQIYFVEDPSRTEEELDESEALGRYTMKKLVMTIFGMLSKKYVYGCVKTNKVAMAEKVTKDNGQQVIDDSESSKKRLKWMQPEDFDKTGDFVMLRSNNLYKDHTSVCQAAERQNPLLLQLYSTHLDDRNGYALTINNLDKSQKKDVKTTYHFVKYQDYAHMRVFENFIGNIFNQLFDSRPDGDIDTDIEKE